MNYATKMGSGASIYTPSFIKTGSAIQKLIGGGGYPYRHKETHIGTYAECKVIS
jgi:hypothetical protein